MSHREIHLTMGFNALRHGIARLQKSTAGMVDHMDIDGANLALSARLIFVRGSTSEVIASFQDGRPQFRIIDAVCHHRVDGRKAVFARLDHGRAVIARFVVTGNAAHMA